MHFSSYQALLCPSCGNTGPMAVKDSRAISTKNAIRRRRQCQCGHRFTTYERVDTDAPATVNIQPTLAMLERTVAELKRRLT